jgi:hypothetical protein
LKALNLSKLSITLPISEIMEKIRWSNEQTFQKFYNKPIDRKSAYQSAVLNMKSGHNLCFHVVRVWVCTLVLPQYTAISVLYSSGGGLQILDWEDLKPIWAIIEFFSDCLLISFAIAIFANNLYNLHHRNIKYVISDTFFNVLPCTGVENYKKLKYNSTRRTLHTADYYFRSLLSFSFAFRIWHAGSVTISYIIDHRYNVFNFSNFTRY